MGKSSFASFPRQPRSLLASGLFLLLFTAVVAAAAMTQNSNNHHQNQKRNMPITTTTRTATKPRILCLHGLGQSGTIFSNKIGGARRKLARHFELDFLDGPVTLPILQEQDQEEQEGEKGRGIGGPAQGGYGWWVRDERGQHVGVEAPFEYIRKYTQGKEQYDALLGFSQGGLLATALALSGDMPTIKAVVTAGAPHVQDTFDVALARALQQSNDSLPVVVEQGKAIPKLHFAGETDAVIPVERVERLSQEGGNGTILLHEKGHLFPTKAEQVNAMVAFLEQHLLADTTA